MNNSQKNTKLLADQVIKLTTKLDHIEANYKRLRCTVKDLGDKKGTCWCQQVTLIPPITIHTAKCDAVYTALYGAERGE